MGLDGKVSYILTSDDERERGRERERETLEGKDGALLMSMPMPCSSRAFLIILVL